MWKRWLVGWAGALLIWPLLWLTPAQAAEEGPLVSVAWLKQQRESVLLIDASPTPAFRAGHIPGAVSVDLFVYGPLEAPAAEMERRIQSWGVSERRTVVIYDPGAEYMATKLHYDLLHRGFPAARLKILDGGLAKWREQGGAVTKDPTPAPPPGDFRITRVDDSIRVRLPEFLVATGDPQRHALVEALDASWHYGETAFFERGGHVPHATMWPPEDFFNPDKTFKPAAEIRRMAAHLGIRPQQQVLSYCGGGLAATVPFFALKFLAGFTDVKVYQESQLEWLQDVRGLPFWTYSAPYLVRDTQWVKSWGGKIMRSYGIGRVSIVDVRPPEQHRQGHVPFALNVPATAIAAAMARPDELAALLGRSGVDREHEAVIVSEQGIDAPAALAWLALQRLGQRRVSVLLDGIERWAAAGQEVTREPTAVGVPKGPGDLSIRPTDYRPQPRQELWVADPKATAGQYPKVFLASGAAVPARKPDGVVKHLPYTQLLNADGTPKPAKDIWKALQAAGVPRYAEVICFADDPGEAAANVLLLRLMGHPDVKAWWP